MRCSYIEHLIETARDGVPVAYLTGTREFWSLPLKVTPAVLVPRPETETLVELALAAAARETGTESVLDLGTGSGAIALAIASERPARARHRRRCLAAGARRSPRTMRAPWDCAQSTGGWAPGSSAVPGERFDVIARQSALCRRRRPGARSARRRARARARPADRRVSRRCATIVAGAPPRI